MAEACDHCWTPELVKEQAAIMGKIKENLNEHIALGLAQRKWISTELAAAIAQPTPGQIAEMDQKKAEVSGLNERQIEHHKRLVEMLNGRMGIILSSECAVVPEACPKIRAMVKLAQDVCDRNSIVDIPPEGDFVVEDTPAALTDWPE